MWDVSLLGYYQTLKDKLYDWECLYKLVQRHH